MFEYDQRCDRCRRREEAATRLAEALAPIASAAAREERDVTAFEAASRAAVASPRLWRQGLNHLRRLVEVESYSIPSATSHSSSCNTCRRAAVSTERRYASVMQPDPKPKKQTRHEPSLLAVVVALVKSRRRVTRSRSLAPRPAGKNEVQADDVVPAFKKSASEFFKNEDRDSRTVPIEGFMPWLTAPDRPDVDTTPSTSTDSGDRRFQRMVRTILTAGERRALVRISSSSEQQPSKVRKAAEMARNRLRAFGQYVSLRLRERVDHESAAAAVSEAWSKKHNGRLCSPKALKDYETTFLTVTNAYALKPEQRRT